MAQGPRRTVENLKRHDNEPSDRYAERLDTLRATYSRNGRTVLREVEERDDDGELVQVVFMFE